MVEEWRPVPLREFARLYEVSNHGRVRSADRILKAKAGSTRRHPGRIMKLKANSRGYVSVYLRNGETSRNATVHRLVAGAFVPNPKRLREVNHLDFDRTNNTSGNLEWTSRLTNFLHAEAAGRALMARKLTDADVAAIRDAVAGGQTNTETAKRFGLNQSTVSRIVAGLRRNHHQNP